MSLSTDGHPADLLEVTAEWPRLLLVSDEVGTRYRSGGGGGMRMTHRGVLTTVFVCLSSPSPPSPRTYLYMVGTLRFVSLDINQPSLATPFILFLVSASVSTAMSTVFYFINFPTTLRFPALLFRSCFCFYWPFHSYQSL